MPHQIVRRSFCFTQPLGGCDININVPVVISTKPFLQALVPTVIDKNGVEGDYCLCCSGHDKNNNNNNNNNIFMFSRASSLFTTPSLPANSKKHLPEHAIFYNIKVIPTLEFVSNFCYGHYYMKQATLTRPDDFITIMKNFPRLQCLTYCGPVEKENEKKKIVGTAVICSEVIPRLFAADCCPRISRLMLPNLEIGSISQVRDFFKALPPFLEALSFGGFNFKEGFEEKELDELKQDLLVSFPSLASGNLRELCLTDSQQDQQQTLSLHPYLIHPTKCTRLRALKMPLRVIETSNSSNSNSSRNFADVFTVIDRIAGSIEFLDLTLVRVNHDSSRPTSGHKSSSPFVEILQTCRQLRRLSIEGLSHAKILTDDDLVEGFGAFSPASPPLLHTFIIDSISAKGLLTVAQSCPYLATLCVPRNDAAEPILTDEVMFALAKNSGKNLRTLCDRSYIHASSSAFTKEGLLALGRSCPNIESLELLPTSEPNLDEGMIEITKNGSIRSLALFGVESLTDATCKAIGMYCSKLESLSFTNNQHVSDEGMVALAEGCACLKWADLGGTNKEKLGRRGIIAIHQRMGWKPDFSDDDDDDEDY